MIVQVMLYELNGWTSISPVLRGGRRVVAAMKVPDRLAPRGGRDPAAEYALDSILEGRPDLKQVCWRAYRVDGDYGLPHPERSIHGVVMRELPRPASTTRKRDERGRFVRA